MEGITLVINCGSSSLKLALFNQQLEKVSGALAECLGSGDAFARLEGGEAALPLAAGASHKDALQAVIEELQQQGLLGDAPLAIGHRVVHGGEMFRDAALINDSVIDAIRECADLAPLHNPVNLIGIEALTALFPEVPQVAVFDTAFHQSLPEHAYLYALPAHFYSDWGVRRYGFHGTNHQFMLAETAKRLGKPADRTSLISAHLGNGCSITAISNGRSVDTSMGLTPLEGLVMGTRSGDVDPGLFDFLKKKGLSAEEVHRILNKESGLLGLSGQTNDMRSLSELADHGHQPSKIAIDVFCFRLARYIAAMMASLDHLDALVFTGGIGENSSRVREQTLSHLALCGFALDPELNGHNGLYTNGQIESCDSRFPVMVIPANEELVIASAARHAAQNQPTN